jgi:hypothetical protein
MYRIQKLKRYIKIDSGNKDSYGRIVYLNEYPEIKFCVCKVMGGWRLYHYASGLRVDNTIQSSQVKAILAGISNIDKKKTNHNVIDVMQQHEKDNINI